MHEQMREERTYQRKKDQTRPKKLLGLRFRKREREREKEKER